MKYDHDLGAERVQLGPAARERARIVVDDADLELLALGRNVGGERHAEDERRDDHAAHEAGQSMVEHESPLLNDLGWISVCAGITSRSPSVCQGQAGRARSVVAFPTPALRA